MFLFLCFILTFFIHKTYLWFLVIYNTLLSIIFMKFSRTLLLLNCLFIILTYSCLDVIQQPGKCSDCLSTEVLQTGYCYAKIRGCQIQQNDAVLGSKCSTCQSGYILSANSCIRTAVLDASNLTISSQIPPVQINTNTLGKD